LLLPACSSIREGREFAALQKLELEYRALSAEDDTAHPEAWSRKADERMKARVDDLIRRYQEFVRKYPNNADAHDLLALIYYENGRPEDALAEWETALRINPNHANAHNGLGQLYSHTGEPLRAITHFQKAIELDPKRAVFHFNLGLMYFTSRYVVMKEYAWDLPRVFAESQKAYRRASELAPDDFDYAKAVAENYFFAKFFLIEDPWDAAIRDWQRCLKIAPDDLARSYVLTCLGRVYLKKGQKPEARAVLQQALRLDSRSAAEHLLRKCE
jgi:tetratricopeptide (TPR) repeat protein